MEKESMELIIQSLEKLGAKLGVAADKIWPWFVKEVYIESITVTIFTILFSILLWKIALYVSKHWRPREEEIYSIYETDHEPLWVGLLIIISIIWIGSTMAFICVAPNIFNPEYHALLSLLNSIK